MAALLNRSCRFYSIIRSRNRSASGHACATSTSSISHSTIFNDRGSHMNAVAEMKAQLQVRHEALRIGGEKIFRDEVIEVRNPYDGTLVGTVPKATLEDVRRAFEFARAYRPALTRYERAAILRRAADAVRARTEEIAACITAEAGLRKKDSIYEAGRVADVLVFGAGEVLKDDGQIFSCDLTPHGKKRRVYTQLDPLLEGISTIAALS